MQRTVPAVSFTTSHRAHAMKSSRMLFGKEMKSPERFKAAWDEMPFSQIGMSMAERHAWLWKQRFELGLRDTHRNSKSKIIGMYVMTSLLTMGVFASSWPIYCYGVYRDWPYSMRRENSREYARRWGADVYYADGKFTKPVFHISPPMLTMTCDEL